MTGAYAMGAPWLGFAHMCGGGRREAKEWFAKMAEAKSRAGQQAFGHWGLWGGPPPFPPVPPLAPWMGRGWGFGRATKARRGDVRAAILAVLFEQPMNGYQLIQEIASRSGGTWKPSPGSIYPTLQQLEDEGLVTTVIDAGRRVFTLTEQGQIYVDEHPEEVEAPWQGLGEPGEDASEVKPLIGQVAAAVWQIMAVGTPDQQAKGREALVELRRKLYAILSEDDSSENEPS
jgi:DNA-binding PadR family transcriptional regulator